MKFFICTYTNKVKAYCDKQFFTSFVSVVGANAAVIVDNTIDNGAYARKLTGLVQNKIPVRRHTCQPGEHQFLRNVAESANVCRDVFLTSGCDHMLVIESDVIPPPNLLAVLEEDAKLLQDKNWGIIGGLYYHGFHDFNKTGLVQYTTPQTILSGCTLYSGRCMVKAEFRWDPTNVAAFPDAFISLDSDKFGYTNWNDHDIICEHLSKRSGSRGHEDKLF